MVINESAYYEGKKWCAYELKDHAGHYKEELRLRMRKESQERKFTCPDCGEPLILCAGPIMEPFFKHYENSHCIIDRKEVNRRNVVARRMLYHLAKDSFPEAVIELDKKLDNKVVPDLWIQTEDAVLVFEYLSYEIKLADWEQKHDFYREHGIVDVWFLNYKKYQYDIKTTFEYMISKTTKVLKFLEYDSGEVILKQVSELSQNRTKWFTKSYPIEDLRIDEQGEAICDYEQYRKEQIALMEYEEKVERLKKLEEAAKRNRNQDRGSQKETYEQQSLFLESANRASYIEQREERVAEKMEQLAKRRVSLPVKNLESQKQRMGLPEEEAADMVSDREIPKEECRKADVLRFPLDSDKVSNQTMKMSAIDELWELPKLTGKEWQIRTGNQNRYLYLKHLNRELTNLAPEEQQAKIREAITLLEQNVDAGTWR